MFLRTRIKPILSSLVPAPFLTIPAGSSRAGTKTSRSYRVHHGGASVLPAAWMDRRFLRAGSIVCAFASALFLVSYLATVVSMVHDENILREDRLRLEALQLKEEALQVQFFGRDRTDALQAYAGSLNLVPIGNAPYMTLPPAASFAQYMQKSILGP